MTATTVRAEDQTTQKATRQHEANGRFAIGNKGGPGNPFARQVAALRQTLLNRTTQKDFEEVAGELIKKAKTGDVAAIKLLFQYTLGKPAPSPDPDHLDVDEWHKLQQSACPPADVQTIFNSLPADMALDFAKVNWPIQMEVNFTRPFLRGLKEMDEREARQAAKAARRAARRAAPSPTVSNGAGSATGVAPLPESQIEHLNDSLLQELVRMLPPAHAGKGDAEPGNRKQPG